MTMKTQDLGKLVLRLAPTVTFFGAHGLAKLQRFAELAGRFPDPLHLGSPVSLSLMVVAEVVCAILVALGFYTRWAAIPPIIGMAVAIFWAHSGQIFGDAELAYLYGTAFLAVVLLGPGRLSLDHRLRRKA